MSRSNLRRPSAVLGVDFRHNSLVVVELKLTGGRFVVSAVGSKEMSVGYLETHAPGGAAYVGQKLRSLIREIGANAKTVVVALPDSATSTRTIELPPIPESELRGAVEGEIRHQKILADHGGRFDFCSLKGRTTGNVQETVVMSAQDIALWHLQDILKEAGLHAEAFVPYHVAAMRYALTAPVTEPTLVISIAANSTEMMIINEADIMMYRRIDVRGLDLVVYAASIDKESNFSETAQDLHETEIPAALKLARDGKSHGIDPVIASRLVTELSRSIEYFKRQNLGQNLSSHAHLITSDPTMSEMKELLSAALTIEIDESPNSLANTYEQSKTSRREESSEQFAVAIGLGLQMMGDKVDHIHPFELAAAARVVDKVTKINRSLVPAAIITGIFVALGLSATLILSSKASQLESSNAQSKAEYNRLRDKYIPLADEAQNEIQDLGQLVLHGIPFPPIMDQISGSLHNDIALTSVTFDIGGVISMQGVSESEEAIVSTLNQLMVSGGFHGTYVNRFEQRENSAIRFNISSSYDLEEAARVALETDSLNNGIKEIIE